MVTEAHVIDPVLLGWDQADRVASEGATDFKHLSLKMDFAFLIFSRDIGHRVKNIIMVRNEGNEETSTQGSQSGM